ncbi:hypothetical protein BMF94_1385 [Rhodotorula taiwanensis]|uniref:Uncharacterized protein n=1 Tax=Rhodotorula taiwanensis TaxID=741276 RepID=A0A2S5BFG1_9BASI|nr:hypothetical protein BMF94_1385 [Rhodotorula taiwanensis]
MKGLLPLYVTVDTARALLTYALLHSGVKLSPTAISLGSEALKLAVASIAIGWAGGRGAGAKQSGFLSRIALTAEGGSSRGGVAAYLKYAVPAALFLANNVMYLGALSYVTPALLQTCVLSKLPLTALLHHIAVMPRRGKEMWLSLACLSLGLILAGSPDALWDSQQRSKITFRDLITGPVIGLTIGVVSACSSIWTELVFREQVEFWTAQFWLYLWGTVLAGLAHLASHAIALAPPSSGKVQQQVAKSSAWPFIAVVLITACSGLSVAAILKQRDNLVKLVGSSLCITTLYVLQHVCFPLAEEVESRAVIGIGILTVSTWAYNYYKDQPNQDGGQTAEPALYTALQLDSGKPEDGSNLDGRPVARGEYANATEPSAIPRPTLFRLLLCGVIISLLAAVPPFLPRPARSIERDFTSFFSPRHIYPADWSKVSVRESQRCVMDAFQDGLEPDRHPSLLADWEERIVHSACPVYPVPDSGLTFHARWRDGTEEAHDFATDTFLASQRLRAGHRLIWWYEANGSSPASGPDEAFRARYLASESPFTPFVEARPLKLDDLARGTCAEESLKQPTSHELLRDLGRNLVLARYGGIWVGDETILLRDLTPLIRTGPLVPGLSDGTSPVDDLLLYGPAWSGLGERILALACKSFLSSDPARNLRGVHETCLRDPRCGVKPFPMQWATGSLVSEDCEPVEEAIFPSDEAETRPAPAHLHGIFAWRARVQSRSGEDPCWKAGSGSALAAIRARTAEILETMPLGLGVDLFPGPGFIDTRHELE